MNSLSILIVEDHMTTAAGIQETLEKAGHRVTALARNFGEAVSSARRFPPDLAIIDIHLEGKELSTDGISTARELLNHRLIPIIYLTAHLESTTVQRALETFPSAYLSKPFRPAELVIQVELAYRNIVSNGRQPVDPAVADSVFLPNGKVYERMDKKQVLYLRADRAYTNIYLIGEDKPRLVALNLGYLTQYFPASNFHRISRSLVVNLNHIRHLESDQLLMSDKTVVSIPEGSRPDLLKKLAIIRTR